MRVTKVSFLDWVPERRGRVAPEPVLPLATLRRQPEPAKEEAPPAPEPDRGLNFDAWA